MTPNARSVGRRIWVSLCAAGAIGVVILAWRVPEPETHGPDRSQRVENVSYMQCAQQAPAPSYGARTLDYCTR
ncbi:MAG: hypothetical protein ACKOQ4_00850 [Mycobacterium sp.]